MPRPQGWKGAWAGRKAGSYKWYEIQDNIAYWREFSRPKILYQEIATYQAFAWDEQCFFSNNKTFIIPDASKYLLGILNSRVTWFFLDKVVSKLQGGAFAMQTPYVSQIPIPVEGNGQPIESKVEQLIAAKQAGLDEMAALLEKEIDELVYVLFCLSPTEIALIEGREVSDEEVEDSAFPGQKITSAPPLMFTGQSPQGSFPERLKRIQALVKQASPVAVQELAAALADENATIVWTAGAGLRQIGGPQVVGVLQAFIAQTADAAAKQEAEKVLRALT